LTTAAAAIFMVTSLVLAIFSAQYGGGSVVLSSPAPKPAVAPSAPAPELTPPATSGPSATSTPEGTGTTDAPPTQSREGEPIPEQK
jgi:hypothetical protein